MKQLSFADAVYAGKRNQTHREQLLTEKDLVVPWQVLMALIQSYYLIGEDRRPAYPLAAMLRVHLMQNWFGFSDPAMEETLYEVTILRHFSGLHLDRTPDETAILNFRRQLERHELASRILEVINGHLGERGLLPRQGSIVDATIIHAPISTKNKDGKCDPEMHQIKKGNQFYFGMKNARSSGQLPLAALPTSRSANAACSGAWFARSRRPRPRRVPRLSIHCG